MNTGCLRCGRLPGNGHTEICALQGEIERLRHDIERHIAMASDLATENERLRAELAEARKPTCNACANFHSCWSRSWNNPSWARVFCPDGERFERVDPVRLYEIDAAMAGGAK